MQRATTQSFDDKARGGGRRIVRFITAVLAIGVVAAGLGTSEAAIAAPEDALTVTVIKPDGTLVQPGEVVAEGTALKLRVQYQKQPAPNDLTGVTRTVQLGSNVTVSGVPAGNTAVTGINPNGNGFDLTFADPWPTGINQGYLDLDFTVNGVAATGEETITWTAGAKNGSVTVVVKNDGDVFEDIGSAAFDKQVNPATLNSHVRVGDDGTGNIVFQGLDPAVIGVPLTYTLTVELPDGSNGDDFAIADQLPAGLSYVPGSFSSTLTTWDANGWNRTSTPLSGASTPAAFSPTITGTGTTGERFTGDIDLPTPSVLTITYQATILNEASRLVVEQGLQNEANALSGNSGSFTHDLTNSATFNGGDAQTSIVSLSGVIPGPCTTGCAGAAFDKQASGASVNVIADGAGIIVDETGTNAPVDAIYTLRADLSQWDGRNSNYTLDRNVVISDTLVPQLTWNSAAADFITVTGAVGSPIASLTQVACPAGTGTDPIANAASGFNTDGYVGMYCVDGQRLLVNVGKNPATDVTITLKTQLHSVAGLTPSGTSTVTGATRYELPNQAQFWHRNGARSNADAPQYPVRLPDDRSAGLNDTAAFTKQGPSGAVSVNPGDRAMVPYTFTVNTAVSGIDAEFARIEDAIDTSVFDLSDLGLIGVSSTYTGLGDVSANVELSLSGGLLVVELASGPAYPAGGTWVVTLQIPTFPLVGKETLDISNYASLYGSATTPLYWSEDSSRATSFGDELEVRKHVYDTGTNGWTTVLVAPEDSNGALVEDVYVYRLQLIAHGSFSGAILAVNDLLPAEADFLGFVAAADVAAGGPVVSTTSVTLGHGVEAVYDPAIGPRGEITLRQATGTVPVGGEVAAYFAVRIDPNIPETVVNSFGGQAARIVPGGPSIDIEKWIDEGTSPRYDAQGLLLNDGFAGDHDAAPGKSLTANTAEIIRFTVSNDGPEPLVDVDVGDRLVSGSGAIADLTCTFPDSTTGRAWSGPWAIGTQFECEGRLPGLDVGTAHTDVGWVTAVGQFSGIPVRDEDAWNGRVPSLMAITGSQAVVGAGIAAGLAVLVGVGLIRWRGRKPRAQPTTS